MAGTTRARRRLSLLAGGSLAAASLMSATGALVAVPTTALAANECGDPTVNGATADVFDCVGTQGAISYATSGNLTLRMNNEVIVTTGGVVVTSTLTDSVTISRIDTPAGTGDPRLVGTAGPGVQVTSSGTGAITVNLADTDTGDNTTLVVQGTTYGVQLTGGATTGTAISVTTTNGSIAATGATGVGVQTTSNSVAGGNTALTFGGSVSGATGVQTTVNGTGTQTITLTAASATVSGGDISGVAGPAVLMNAGSGASTLTVGAGRTVRANGAINAVVEIANATGARTVTNNGTIRSNDATATGYDDLAVRVGAGAGAVIVNNNASALLSGRVLLGNSGAATINNNSVWHAADLNTLGLGVSTLNNNAGAVLATNAGGLATTLDFQGGVDTFANAGLLAVGEGAQGAATLTVLGLEAWNNSGKILFGANAGLTNSDGVANDRIVTTATLNGIVANVLSAPSDSTLVMDVDLTGTQLSCAAAVAADCLDIRGGAVIGESFILVNPVGAGRGLAGRIVLVDAGGGSNALGRFSLDPDSPGYALDGAGEAIIDAGILHYAFAYDADAKQHFLVGAPDVEALQPGLFAVSARGAWDQATSAWFERGGDVRYGLSREAGSSSAAWLRVSAANIDYSQTDTFSLGGVTTVYDTSYEQDVVVLVGGVDLVRASGEGRAWVFGLTAGHADSDTAYTSSPSDLSLSGYILGAYASFVGGPVFVDAIVNTARFDLAYKAPNLGAAALEGKTQSYGFQAEAGWRLNVPDMPAFIEPLVSVSYVRTQLDDMAFPDADVFFQEVGDFRAGLGLRVSGDAQAAGWTTRFSVTGRVWEQFDGQSEYALANAVIDLPLTYDDDMDRLGEVGFSVNALGLDDRLSLQAGVRLQFKRDYENSQFSLGARYAF